MLVLMIVAFVLGMIFAAGLTTYDEVRTEIEIEGSAETVWNTVTDFEKYADWNTFITKVDGKFDVGEEMDVTIALPFSKSMDFKLSVLHIDTGRSFVWQGTTLEASVLDGTHTFEIESLGEGRVRFSQREKFSGILLYLVVPFIKGSVERNFIAMNQTLKNRVEGKVYSSDSSQHPTSELPSGTV